MTSEVSLKQHYNNVRSEQHGSKESGYAAFSMKNNIKYKIKFHKNIAKQNKILYNFIVDKNK